jgi:uncharacterized protein YdhG (YjbR/CyaY superfamily)
MRKATPGPSKRNASEKDVESYLAGLPKAVRDTLEKLRRTIKAAAPKAEEVISYQIPCYKYHGPLVFFAAFENHLSLFAGKSIPVKFRRELKPYHISGTTIHFSVKKPLPASLVRKIVKAKIAENESRAEQKRSKQSPGRRGLSK